MEDIPSEYRDFKGSQRSTHIFQDSLNQPPKCIIIVTVYNSQVLQSRGIHNQNMKVFFSFPQVCICPEWHFCVMEELYSLLNWFNKNGTKKRLVTEKPWTIILS